MLCNTEYIFLLLFIHSPLFCKIDCPEWDSNRGSLSDSLLEFETSALNRSTITASILNGYGYGFFVPTVKNSVLWIRSAGPVCPESCITDTFTVHEYFKNFKNRKLWAGFKPSIFQICCNFRKKYPLDVSPKMIPPKNNNNCSFLVPLASKFVLNFLFAACAPVRHV